jgi:hypothetical protein
VIRLQFVLGTGLSSAAIAWFSAGTFSHVDAILRDGSLLGARSDQVGGQHAGVRIRPPYYEHWRSRVVMSLPATPEKELKFYEYLKKQLGKPYDMTAIWGFATGRNWRDPQDWFCSELQAAALEVAEVIPRLYTPANKITPATLATLLSAIGATT